MSATRLDRLRTILDAMESSDERARSRLRERPPGGWCFAILGASTDPSDGVGIGAYGGIRPVEEPPGEIALARALKDQSRFGAIGRYMPGLSYELALSSEITDPQMALSVGWSVIVALRLRTDAEFIVPAVADHSWETIAGAPERSVRAQLLEDRPGSKRASPYSDDAITEEAGLWVGEHLLSIMELRSDKKFHLAFECLSESYSQESWRVATTLVWAGLEALAQVRTELTFRLALIIASLVEQAGPARLQTYRAVKKLYGMRSRAVHGDSVSEEQLREHVVAARGLLKRCLIRIIELGHMPVEADLEGLLVGVPLTG